MAMTASEIEELIIKAFPNAKVIIDDLRGDGDHYAAQIIAEELEVKLVYNNIKWSTMLWVAEWEKNYMH